MFEVADLTHVWVQAQVYEHQFGLVHEGQTVEATVEAFPGRDFSPASGVHPADARPGPTRTVEVRFDLENPGPQAPAGHVRDGDARPWKIAGSGRIAGRRSKLRDAGLGVHGAERSARSPRPSWARWAIRSRSRSRPEGLDLLRSCPPKLKAQPAKYLALLAPPPGRGPQRARVGGHRHRDRKVVYVESEPASSRAEAVPRPADR